MDLLELDFAVIERPLSIITILESKRWILPNFYRFQ